MATKISIDFNFRKCLHFGFYGSPNEQTCDKPN